MDDPATGNNQSNAAPTPDDASVGASGEQEGGKLTTQQQQASQVNHGPSHKSAWERWQEHTLAERVMAYFTGVVAICAALQVWILIGGSGQTDQLIKAAKINAGASERNAAAAESFSTSVGNINSAMGTAVIKLDAQARASQKAADAAKSAVQNAKNQTLLDQRPWVGLKEPTCGKCQWEWEGGPPSRPGRRTAIIGIENLEGLIVNTGKTPAEDVTVSLVFHYGAMSFYTECNPGEGMRCVPPQYELRNFSAAPEDPVYNNHTRPPINIGAVAPNQTNPIIFVPADNGEVFRDADVASILGLPSIYVEGTITYHAAWKGTKGETQFCFFPTLSKEDRKSKPQNEEYHYCNTPGSNTMR